ncbi:hypothetical protein AGDE_15247 [Angomonas deanei]|uniref:Phage tail lysozyme, putative n=1 Tax=Angomonas deanei TaxID=59799 RepID=A0A7G2CEM0_9TRYP|nr:hypothetical protein AGDE_15247 [Angomonas deanei]CAD2217314.1 Phage tail lysozyme, putative [Angomonas deanei]|eukprot:EPY19421.1 hypothetical protein AGDE_15247 [Angomonas deanei]
MLQSLRDKYDDHKRRVDERERLRNDPTSDPNYYQDVINRSLLGEEVAGRPNVTPKTRRPHHDPTADPNYHQDVINRSLLNFNSETTPPPKEPKKGWFGLNNVVQGALEKCKLLKEELFDDDKTDDPYDSESNRAYRSKFADYGDAGIPFSLCDNLNGDSTYYYAKSNSCSSSRLPSSSKSKSRSTKHSSSPETVMSNNGREYSHSRPPLDPPIKSYVGSNLNVVNNSNNTSSAFYYYHHCNRQSESNTHSSVNVDLSNIENQVAPSVPPTAPPFVLEKMESEVSTRKSYSVLPSNSDRVPPYTIEEMHSKSRVNRVSFLDSSRSPSVAPSVYYKVMETPEERRHLFIVKCLPHLGVVGTCALYGNVYVETGGTFDPKQKEMHPPFHDAMGLFQMNKEMRAYFEKYCAEFYIRSHHLTATIVTTPSTAGGVRRDFLDPDTMDAQLTFVINEIATGSYIGAGNAATLRKSFYLLKKDISHNDMRVTLTKKEYVSPPMVEAAAEMFCNLFERPSIPHLDRRKISSVECLEYIREQGLTVRM